MALYTIGDLHLSFGVEKPMDIFEGWENYQLRLENNWKRLITDDDTVIIPGDISWGISYKEALADFAFINALPGKKIILKGNHDLWWQTTRKTVNFLNENKFSTISMLFNNSYEVDNYLICGTRGWMFDDGHEENELVIRREAGRLKLSLDYQKSDKEIIAFMHYPPIYMDQKADLILDLLREYNIKRCFYGHLHGKTINYAFNGNNDNTVFKLVSADALGFCPYRID